MLRLSTLTARFGGWCTHELHRESGFPWANSAVNVTMCSSTFQNSLHCHEIFPLSIAQAQSVDWIGIVSFPRLRLVLAMHKVTGQKVAGTFVQNQGFFAVALKQWDTLQTLHGEILLSKQFDRPNCEFSTAQWLSNPWQHPGTGRVSLVSACISGTSMLLFIPDFWRSSGMLL
jgi:hypothetical protein